MSRRPRPLVVLLVSALLPALGGCPARVRDHADGGAPRCTKFGDNCEFAPGKLGSCVIKDGCPSAAQSDCFVCQSQH